MSHIVPKFRKWGVIFVVNLAPSDELDPEKMWEELKNKEKYFTTLVNEISNETDYKQVGVALIVNKLVLPQNKSEQKVFALANTNNAFEDEMIELPTNQIPNGNIGDPNLLKSLFLVSINHLQAQQYILFTWDHGFGHGIFSRSIGVSEKLFNVTSKETDRPGRFFLSFQNFFYSQKVDWMKKMPSLPSDQFPDVLTNNELADAISSSFPGGKVAVLAMMNCCQQLIDTGYAFRDSVQFLVAPQSVMWWEGYHYKNVIHYLNTTSSNSSEAAIMILNSEREKLQIEDPEGSLHSTLSVVDCRVSIDVCNKTADAVNILINRPNQYKKYFKRARISLDNLSTLNIDVIEFFANLNSPNSRKLLKDHAPNLRYVDFYSFWTNLYNLLPNNDDLRIILEHIILLKNSHILAVSKSPNIYTMEIPGRSVQLSASGVSIFFPTTVKEINNPPCKFIKDTFYDRFNSRLQTHFDRDTKWSNFVRNIYMVN